MSVSHDDLARSLADHLRGERRMVWCDIQLGSAGSVRPDVYAIYKSFAHPAPTAYEVKASVSDFRADVTTGKWQNYLRYACGVYFACEAGLLTKADIPAHCGLMVFTSSNEGGRWRAAKKATLSPVTVPQDALLKLLIDGVEREGPIARRKHWSSYEYANKLQKQFGAVVAQTVHDRLAVEQEIASAHHSAENIVADAQRRAKTIRDEAVEALAPLRSELCGLLGLQPDADRYRIGAAVHQTKAALAQHPAVAQLQNVANQLRHALAQVEMALRPAHEEVEV